MRITDYTAITEFDPSDVFIVDGDNGTRKVFVQDAILAALHMTAPENHRLFFRGKNL